MTWSRSYTGSSAEEVAAKFTVDVMGIQVGLPEFERDAVVHLAKATELALKSIPPGARVTLSVNGHGFRRADGGDELNDAGGGALGMSINYVMPGKPKPIEVPAATPEPTTRPPSSAPAGPGTGHIGG
jgi:hypothetical protein